MIIAGLGVQEKYELWKLPIIGAEVGKLIVRGVGIAFADKVRAKHTSNGYM